MPASVPRFRSLVAAQLVLPRTPPPAAQPARHVHRLKNGVHEHVVVRAPVLSGRPLLGVQVLLPRRLRRLSRRLLRWRCGLRALLPEPHPSCPLPGGRRARLSLTATGLARAGLARCQGNTLAVNLHHAKRRRTVFASDQGGTMAGFLERLGERRARRRASRDEARKRRAADPRARVLHARKDSETRSWEQGPGSGTDIRR